MINIYILKKQLTSNNRIIKIVLTLIIALLFIYGILDIMQENVENVIIFEGGAVNNIGALTNTVKLKQEINIKSGQFNNISIFTTRLGNPSNGKLIFRVYSSDNEIPVVNKAINVKSIPNNQYILFDFPTIKYHSGKKYYFTIETTSTDVNNVSSIWYNPNEIDDFSLFINNEKIKGKLCYKVGYKQPHFILNTCLFISFFIWNIFFFYFSNELITKKSKIVASSFFVLSIIFIYFNIDLFYNENKFNPSYFSVTISLVFSICYCLLYNGYFLGKFEKIYAAALLFIVPFALLVIIELFNNNYIYNMSMKSIVINYVCLLIIYLIIYVITNKIGISLIFGSLLIYLIGLTCYYVLLFTGSPIVPSDFYAIGTTKSILESYTFKINLLILNTLLLLILICIMCKNVRLNLRDVKTKKYLRLSTAIGVFLAIVILNIFFYRVDTFIESDYQTNGFIVEFLMKIKHSKIEKPQDYSIEKVNNIISEMNFNSKDKTTENTKIINNPNIIAIMNESFADLKVINNFNTNQDYMPFIRSLNKNAIKGNLFVSTYGGGTSLSEWEFLTGNSMAFMPNVIPYGQYINTPSNSIATTLKSVGYKTIAIHPFGANNWNRNKVYPLLGFDKFITIKDFENPETLRDTYVSDAEDYKKIIEQYKEKGKDDRVFIFNVTIQNHGGYFTDNSIFQHNVYLTDYNYNDVNEYLSLIKKSDEAFKELVKYFSSQNEPTVIIMFGDHLPGINTDFYEKLYKKNLESLTLEEMQKRYTVPLVIWANYNIKEQYIDKISTNYLATLILKVANQPLTGYNKFLDQIYNEIPVINKNGYIDSKGKYHTNKEIDLSQLLNSYKMLQYNNMFDSNNKVRSFFWLNK